MFVSSQIKSRKQQQESKNEVRDNNTKCTTNYNQQLANRAWSDQQKERKKKKKEEEKKRKSEKQNRKQGLAKL